MGLDLSRLMRPQAPPPEADSYATRSGARLPLRHY